MFTESVTGHWPAGNLTHLTTYIAEGKPELHPNLGIIIAVGNVKLEADLDLVVDQ